MKEPTAPDAARRQEDANAVDAVDRIVNLILSEARRRDDINPAEKIASVLIDVTSRIARIVNTEKEK